MSRHKWYQLIRLGFVALGSVAVIVQLIVSIDNNRSIPNFLSYFTIQSNLIAIVVLLATAVMGLQGKETSRTWEMWRGAAASWMATTGIVFAALLAGIGADLDLTEPWIDTVLHRIMPIVIVLDWLLAPPRHRLSFKPALVWAIFPLAHCAYSLIRGPIVDWYPYPFLNPTNDGGYLAVAGNSVGISVLYIGLIWAVIWSGNRMRTFWQTSSDEFPQ